MKNSISTLFLLFFFLCLFFIPNIKANEREFKIFIVEEPDDNGKTAGIPNVIEVKITYPAYYNDFYIYVCNKNDCKKKKLQDIQKHENKKLMIKDNTDKKYIAFYKFIRKGPIILYGVSSQAGKSHLEPQLKTVSDQQYEFIIE
jgi:hypothetical protein